MSQQQNFPAPVLNIFSVMSNWMFADPMDGSKKRPSIRFGVYGNVPRITVKTNVEGDMNHGKIDFNMDLATFAVGMAYLNDLAEGKPDTPTEMKLEYQDDFVAGKKLDRVMTIATWVIGKATDGRIYMAVISSQQSRPRIRFFFGPTKYHNLKAGDGSAYGADKLSQAYARGIGRSVEPMVLQLLTGSAFDPNAKNVANPANFNGGAGGGGNGQQRQGGNSYNNNQQAPRPKPAGGDSFDAELPDFGF
jgi:hypothetical protein